jgi:hypothetical protein
MTIRIKQDCAHSGDGWWNWSVWLEGPDEEIKGVREVVYTLHPTFVDPVQTIRTRRNGFKLSSVGWGEFEIHVEIVGKDGKIARRKHWLKLEEARTTRRTSTTKGAAAGPERRLRAFVSFGVADSQIAESIRAGLVESGFEVSSPGDVISGVPLEKAVANMIDRADVFVFVVSGRPSLWQSREMTWAAARGVGTIVPVVVGPEVRLPEALAGRTAVHVANAEEARAKTLELAQKVMRTAEQ